MAKNTLSCGRGNINITGCRISLAPMSDDYISIILGAINEVDTSRVWRYTDALGALYSGQQKDVVYASKSLFSAAYKDNIHMSASLTFSKGCPGDTAADYLGKLEEKTDYPELDNEEKICEATISFYTFGVADYMTHIYKVIDILKDKNVYSEKSHYSTIISGSIKDIFAIFWYVKRLYISLYDCNKGECICSSGYAIFVYDKKY